MSFHLSQEYLPPRGLVSAQSATCWALSCARDYSSGAARDAYMWRTYRRPCWARIALPGEYDGVRLKRDANATGHRHVLVAVSTDHGKLDRIFLPLAPDQSEFSDIAHDAGATRLWRLASDARDEHPDAVMRDVLSIGGLS